MGGRLVTVSVMVESSPASEAKASYSRSGCRDGRLDRWRSTMSLRLASISTKKSVTSALPLPPGLDRRAAMAAARCCSRPRISASALRSTAEAATSSTVGEKALSRLRAPSRPFSTSLAMGRVT